jgi:hypothetical protein
MIAQHVARVNMHRLERQIVLIVNMDIITPKRVRDNVHRVRKVTSPGIEAKQDVVHVVAVIMLTLQADVHVRHVLLENIILTLLLLHRAYVSVVRLLNVQAQEHPHVRRRHLVIIRHQLKLVEVVHQASIKTNTVKQVVRIVRVDNTRINSHKQGVRIVWVVNIKVLPVKRAVTNAQLQNTKTKMVNQVARTVLTIINNQRKVEQAAINAQYSTEVVLIKIGHGKIAMYVYRLRLPWAPPVVEVQVAPSFGILQMICVAYHQ